MPESVCMHERRMPPSTPGPGHTIVLGMCALVCISNHGDWDLDPGWPCAIKFLGRCAVRLAHKHLFLYLTLGRKRSRACLAKCICYLVNQSSSLHLYQMLTSSSEQSICLTFSYFVCEVAFFFRNFFLCETSWQVCQQTIIHSPNSYLSTFSESGVVLSPRSCAFLTGGGSTVFTLEDWGK